RRDRDGFVRHNPDGASIGLVHLHGKAHGRIHGADSASLEFGNDRRGDVVHFVARTMKFEVRDGTGSAAYWLPSHPYQEAQQRFRPGVIPENLHPLRFYGRATDFHDPNIICSMIHSYTP